MHKILFVFELQSAYEDDSEDITTEVEIFYEGETIKSCLEQAVENYDFDDESVMNSEAESELIETNCEIKGIYEINGENRVEVSDDIYDEYDNLNDEEFDS